MNEQASIAATIKIEPAWKALLAPEFDKPYFRALTEFLRAEKAAGQIIYPPGSLIFNAFSLTPPDKVRVVILGQDPYHGAGQAHGLCFSVPRGIKPPPSLQNIFQELSDDLQIPQPEHGCLESWALQGVFLLNATLTVRAGQAASHQKQGWEAFTDAVIDALNAHKTGLVFILWGNPARAKAARIDRSKHHILEAAHPSPLSAYKGFFGCRHFSATNRLLAAQGQAPINWQLP